MVAGQDCTFLHGESWSKYWAGLCIRLQANVVPGNEESRAYSDVRESLQRLNRQKLESMLKTCVKEYQGKEEWSEVVVKDLESQGITVYFASLCESAEFKQEALADLRNIVGPFVYFCNCMKMLDASGNSVVDLLSHPVQDDSPQQAGSAITPIQLYVKSQTGLGNYLSDGAWAASSIARVLEACNAMKMAVPGSSLSQVQVTPLTSNTFKLCVKSSATVKLDFTGPIHLHPVGLPVIGFGLLPIGFATVSVAGAAASKYTIVMSQGPQETKMLAWSVKRVMPGKHFSMQLCIEPQTLPDHFKKYLDGSGVKLELEWQKASLLIEGDEHQAEPVLVELSRKATKHEEETMAVWKQKAQEKMDNLAAEKKRSAEQAVQAELDKKRRLEESGETVDLLDELAKKYPRLASAHQHSLGSVL